MVMSFIRSQLVVLRVVQLAHQPVDVGRRVAADVGDEQRDELGWDVVEHGAVHVHLGQNLPWNELMLVRVRMFVSEGGRASGVTFSERKHLVRGHKLVEGVFFIGKLKDTKTDVVR